MRIAGREVPDWAVYAGVGLVGGAGYILWKRHKASSAAAADNSGSFNNGGASTGSVGTSASQQPSIVPYYLTGNSGQQRGTYAGSQGGGVGQAPLPVPVGVPGGGNILSPSNNVISSSTPTPPPPPPPVAAPPPPPPPAPAPPSTPAPAMTQNNNLPADVLAKITANGEHIIASIPSPNGGAWYLGSKGGVFAVNAPFYGSPLGNPAINWVSGNRQPAAILPNGAGYTVVDTAGERYSFLP